MKKQNYIAPEVEQMTLRLEENFMGSINSVSNALGHSTTESATDYNNGDAISW